MSCVVIYGKGKLSDAEMSEVKCPLNVSDRERRQYVQVSVVITYAVTNSCFSFSYTSVITACQTVYQLTNSVFRVLFGRVRNSVST